jgi:hypothetical protein
MNEFTFADLGPGFNVTGTTEVFASGAVEPTTLIRSNQSWFVRVRLQTEGLFNPFIVGNWHVRLRLERLGPGAEMNLPAAGDEIVALTPAAGSSNYLININTAAGAVATGAYKLVTTVTYENGGIPGPIAGYSEGPIVQFY